jgi:hypothetical protein
MWNYCDSGYQKCLWLDQQQHRSKETEKTNDDCTTPSNRPAHSVCIPVQRTGTPKGRLVYGVRIIRGACLHGEQIGWCVDARYREWSIFWAQLLFLYLRHWRLSGNLLNTRREGWQMNYVFHCTKLRLDRTSGPHFGPQPWPWLRRSSDRGQTILDKGLLLSNYVPGLWLVPFFRFTHILPASFRHDDLEGLCQHGNQGY